MVDSSMTGKSARKSHKWRGPSRDINPAQVTHLWNPDAEVCELRSDASLPSSAFIAFPRLHPFTKPVLILAEEFSSTFVPRGYAVLYPISRSGT